MITVAARETRHDDLPEPVGGLDIVNETIASLDLEIAIEDQRLKVAVLGIHLGKTQDAPFEPTKKKWALA